MVVTVCVGSSCHVRGSQDVIKLYERLILEHNLHERVTLKGSFCMDRCTEGVNLEIDGESLSARTIEDADRLFREKVMGKCT